MPLCFTYSRYYCIFFTIRNINVILSLFSTEKIFFVARSQNYFFALALFLLSNNVMNINCFLVWADEEWLKKYAMKEDEDEDGKGESENAAADAKAKPVVKKPRVNLCLMFESVNCCKCQNVLMQE